MTDLCTRVRHALGSVNHDQLELEWRIGHRQGAFRPGVGREAWTRLQRALEASPAMHKSYVQTTERLGGGCHFKCVCDAAGRETWVHKVRLADVDEDPRNSRPWSVRASVSSEKQVAPPHAGQSATMAYERQKQRWSYRHRCWSIDLTKVRSNLPADLDDDQEAYEVEVELVDHGMFFERTVEHLVEWGWRIADELCDLMAARAGP